MILIKLYDKIEKKNLEFLGRGTQGSVYKIDNEKCIKIFKKRSSCKDELHSLLISQSNSCFPRLYSYGENYIVREYIKGIPLDEYLSSNPINDVICHKIIELYLAMRYVGFERLDSALFHIFILSSGELKLIDTAKAMKKKYLYPHIILQGLFELNCKDYFLYFVKENYSDIYVAWQNTKLRY